MSVKNVIFRERKFGYDVYRETDESLGKRAEALMERLRQAHQRPITVPIRELEEFKDNFKETS